jgi:Flp pilus assembly pilin Flp
VSPVLPIAGLRAASDPQQQARVNLHFGLRQQGTIMQETVLRLTVAVQNLVANAREREEGQTFVEYALLIAGIAVLLIVAVIFLKDRIGDLFSNTGSSVTNPIGGGS